MQLVREKQFWDIYYNSDLNILELYWKKSDREIEVDEFKDYLFELVNFIETHKVEGFLVDARAYHLVMSLEVQSWHDENIIPLYVKNGIQNIVFIFTEEDLIPFLSVEQTFEEQKAMTILTRFTDNIEKARNYFLKANPKT